MEPLSKHFTSCPKAFYRSIYHIKLKQQWTLKTSLWQNIFSRIRTSKVRKGERLSLYWSIVALLAQDYTVFLHMKWLDASPFPFGWGVSPSQSYPLPPPLKQLLHLGGERHCESKCSAHELTRTGLKCAPLNLGSSSLTTIPWCLPHQKCK